MVDVTMDEVQRRNLKHVGIVDFLPAHLSVYPRPLNQLGMGWAFLPDDMLPDLYQAVLAVSEGRVGKEGHQIARAALTHLRAQNVDGVILACTEIPFMLPESDSEMDIINLAQLLAEAAVRFAIQ
jgi:aspartate racemase